MPIYEYAAVAASCDYCRGHFEQLEKMSGAPLIQCPKCGNVVKRVLSAPSVVSGQAHLLKESTAAKNGFTQYRRAGGGVYEKTAGKGPKFIGGE